MTSLKYLSALVLLLPLHGSPVRAEDYNKATQTLNDAQKKKDQTQKSIIQNIKSAPPKGSTGPTVPTKPTQGNAHKN